MSPESTSASPARGTAGVGPGCTGLAAASFVAVGVFMLWLAVQGPGTADTGQIVMFLAGLAFTALGFSLIAFAQRAGRVSRKLQEAKDRYPAMPWMWRDDWAAGRVTDGNAGGSFSVWMFTLIWNLISWTLIAALLSPFRANQLPSGALFVLLFPLIGIAMLLAAVRVELRRRRFGSSHCRVVLPLRAGGDARLTVETQMREAPAQLLLKLTCIRRIFKKSYHSQVMDHVLWQDDRTIEASEAMPGPEGMSFPATFRIPHDARQTSATDPYDLTFWRLEVSADVPGIDFAAFFELPVYGVAADVDESLPERSVSERDLRGITSTSTAAGERLEFAPFRVASLATNVTLFAVLFFLVTAFLAANGHPIFAAVFGSGDLLLWIAALDAWFGASTVEAGSDGLHVTKRWLFLRRRFFIPAGDIRSIVASISATKSKGSDADAYYSIDVLDVNGKRRSIASYIATMHAAETLAARLRQATQRNDAAGA